MLYKINIFYENLPRFCLHCGRLTHATTQCPFFDNPIPSGLFGDWLNAKPIFKTISHGKPKGKPKQTNPIDNHSANQPEGFSKSSRGMDIIFSQQQNHQKGVVFKEPSQPRHRRNFTPKKGKGKSKFIESPKIKSKIVGSLKSGFGESSGTAIPLVNDRNPIVEDKGDAESQFRSKSELRKQPLKSEKSKFFGEKSCEDESVFLEDNRDSESVFKWDSAKKIDIRNRGYSDISFDPTGAKDRSIISFAGPSCGNKSAAENSKKCLTGHTSSTQGNKCKEQADFHKPSMILYPPHLILHSPVSTLGKRSLSSSKAKSLQQNKDTTEEISSLSKKDSYSITVGTNLITIPVPLTNKGDSYQVSAENASSTEKDVDEDTTMEATRNTKRSRLLEYNSDEGSTNENVAGSGSMPPRYEK